VALNAGEQISLPERHLWEECERLRRLAPRWWTVTLLLFPAITLTAAGTAMALGLAESPLDLDVAAGRISDPLGLLLTAGFILAIGRHPRPPR
jgi:hypothetical protein